MTGKITKVIDYFQEEYEINWKIPNFSSILVQNGGYYDSPSFSFDGHTSCLRIYPNGYASVFTGCIGIYIIKITGSCSTRFCYTLGLKTFEGDKYLEHHRTSISFTNSARHYGVPVVVTKAEILRAKSVLMPDDVITFFYHVKRSNATENSDQKGIKRKYKEISTQTQEEKNLEYVYQDYKKILLDGSNHDLILKVGDKEFRAHRDILKARSQVFYSMLTHDMVEKNSDDIKIPDCDPEAMELFLMYVYCGRVEGLDQSNMLGLYYIADKYEMKSLKEECHNFIKTSLNTTNFCDIIQLALNHCDSSLSEYATDFFLCNVVDILRTVEWQTFLKTNSTVANELFLKYCEKKK